MADAPVKRSRLRRIARIAARLLLGVFVLALLAVGFLHTPWGKELVRARLEAALGAAVDGTVTVGSLDYGFLFDGIDVGQVAIRDRTGAPAIAIGALHVDLDRGSVLGSAPVIERLDITGLAVTAVKLSDGRTNLVTLAKPSGRAPLAAITVRALAVHGDVSLTQADGVVIALHELAVTGSLVARPARHELDATLGALAAHVEVTRPGAPTTRAELSLAGLTIARRADAEDLDARGLVLGALSIDGLRGHVTLQDGLLASIQTLAVTGARVDHTQLATELGRALLLQDLTFDGTASGPVAAIAIHGAVATGTTRLALDGTVDLSAPARPAYHLALAGRGASVDLVAPGSATRVPPIATDVDVRVDGAGVTLADADAELAIEMGATRIGAIPVERVAATLRVNRGVYTIEALTARGLGFQVAARGDVAADTTLHLRVTVEGSPAEAMRVLQAAGIEIPRRVPRLARLAFAMTAAGKIGGGLDVQLEPATIAVAGGVVGVTAAAHVEAQVVQGASTTLTLRGLGLRQLAAMAGAAPPPVVEGAISGTIALARTPTSRKMTYAVRVALRRPALTVVATGGSDGQTATARAMIVRAGDRAVLGTLRAEVAVDDHGLAPARAWHVVLDLAQRPLGELAALLPTPPTGPVPEGTVSLHAELAGTPARPRGTIDATVAATASELGPARAVLHAVLAPTARGLTLTTTGTARVDAWATPLALLAGTVTLPPLPFTRGVLDVARLRAGLAHAVIDGRIDLPERALASLPRVPAMVAALGGQIGGAIAVRGAPPAISFDGQLAWRGYHTADGAEAVTTLAVTGTPAALTATVVHAGALTLTAEVERAGDRVTIAARARVPETPLRAVLPALPMFAADALHGAELGRLHGDLGVHLALAGGRLESSAITGSLAVTGGAITLPGSTRRWSDLALELAGDPAGLRLVGLDVHERDAQVADRHLHASGLVTLAGGQPTTVALAVTARDWLALGSRSPIFSDAPTAAVDLDARVAIDLTAPITAIDATIDHLDLRNPDRRDRAHQAETSSIAGDIIFVDDPAANGKLPAPPAAPVPDPAARPLDIRVHLAQPIHALRAPLDITARGELAIPVRDGIAAPRGELTLVTGTLTTFGHVHDLVDGHVRFTADHPHGELDLTFTRRLPDWSARGLSRPERGVQIHLTGEPTKPVVAIRGVANASLPEVFAMTYAGRPQYVAPPGLPATATVEVPRGDQLNILAYLSLVLPQLLFLDRVSAWADPTEPRGAYGRIRDVEADRYLGADERARVRVVARPTQPGRSTAEAQWDHLWLHTDHAILGAGVRAGDRGGGGLGVFFEWSSAQ